MKDLKRIGLVGFLLVFMASLVFAGGPRAKIFAKGDLQGKESAKKPFREGEVLVKFQKGVAIGVVNNIAAKNAAIVGKRFKILSKLRGYEYVLLKSSKSKTMEMVKALRNEPRVLAVSPNYLNKSDATPSDPRFGELWGMHNTGQTGGTEDADIDAPEAWEVATGSSNVVVVVIDSGLDYTHEDLAANAWVNAAEQSGTAGVDDDGNGYVDDVHGIDPCNGDTDPMDDNGHGTHCAGTIGAVANNGVGVAGVNWNVKVMGLKFLDAGGSGYNSDAIECIEYAIDQKVNYGQNIPVINASWGGGSFDQTLKDAIDAAGAVGILFCAAAGNSGTDNDSSPHYPSSYDSGSIIAVTATDHNDELVSGMSNWGATSVDLAAPGDAILSTIPPAYVPQAGDIFFDDVESGAGNWVHGGTNDTWAITSTLDSIFVNPSFPVPSPPNFWADSPGVYYVADTDSWLAYNADIDLSGYVGQDIFLGIGAAMYMESGWDSAIVEISADSGATWTEVYDFTDDAYYWSNWAWPIPDAFKTAHFRMRFHLISDDSYNYPGWNIDNIGIGVPNLFYDSWSGTSMATPHVSGAVALMASQFPSETVRTRKNRILATVDTLASLDGTCVTAGRLNLHSAITYVAPAMCLLSTWDGQGVYYRDFISGAWVKIATPATLIAAGDLDADRIDDLIGIWPSQNGLWAKYSTSGAWAKLSTTARDIAIGDMNGDGNQEVLGSWDGQGVYYRNSISGAWVKMGSPAEQLTAGDLDGDGVADLIGIWPGQGGVWVKYSLTASWAKLASTALDIGAGDMDGDGREDLVGTWEGQGTFYRNSISGAWVKLSSPATMVAAGDLEGDTISDLIGMFPNQNGIWVKYSEGGNWAHLGDIARHIAAGWMSGWNAASAAVPAGNAAQGPGSRNSLDLSANAPGGSQFQWEEEANLVPQQDAEMEQSRIPGPGEFGFQYLEERALDPGLESRSRSEAERN